MTKLINLLKDIFLKEEECNCGCDKCNEKHQMSLLQPVKISTGLQYHLEHKLPLTENIYRTYSDSYFKLINEVRNLHNQGLQGHAPNQGSNFGIMTNQYGLSLVLNSWDTLIIDWQYENQFYCVQRENLKPTTLTLSPLEREEIGTKAIMIKLSNSQALVIESRRRDKWSSGYNGFPGLPVGFYGLIVYKVDTTAKPLYGVEEPDGPDWKDSSTAYAYLIRNLNVDHGYINGAPQSGRIDLNFVMYEGESLTTNGIKISLIKSGDHDQVKIEKEINP